MFRILPARCLRTRSTWSLGFVVAASFTLFGSLSGVAQRDSQKVRTVSIPISIFTKQELKQGQVEEIIQVDRLIVRENREEQTILSIRSITEAPLSLAILIQDGLTSNVNLQLGEIREFVKQLPEGSRVMIGYLRGNNLEVRQKFTTDLERASRTFRIVNPNPSSAPSNPYEGLIDAMNRFDALPAGRRAVLMVSDGLDISDGLRNTSPTQSLELERAILQAQRKNVAVFSFYSPTAITENGSGLVVLNAQSSLVRLSDDTGGRAFFQGTIAPISFDPFFQDLRILLNRQFLLTYLSKNMKKGYYRVDVSSTNPEVKIEHPKGYYHR